MTDPILVPSPEIRGRKPANAVPEVEKGLQQKNDVYRGICNHDTGLCDYYDLVKGYFAFNNCGWIEQWPSI
jgi:hypothetical protein